MRITNVEKFRKAIESKIPSLCDSVDELDYEKMEDALSIIYARPKNMHQMAHYQLEKIYSYLDERIDYIDPASNEYWGLQQAYEFSQEFAKNFGAELNKKLDILAEMHRENLRHHDVTEKFFTAALQMLGTIAANSSNRAMATKFSDMVNQVAKF